MSAMILVLDNYDSFTYNLVQLVMDLDARPEVKVIRNDVMAPEQAQAELKPTHVIISPGPCSPNEAGLSMDYIRHFHGRVPLLGVCLGHQAMGQVFGGKVVRAPRLMHGKTSKIVHDGRGIYAGLPSPFTATRYHSLIVDPEGLDGDIELTAWSEDQHELMGLRSRSAPTEGVQFHPESFLTDSGRIMLTNFIRM